MLKTRVGAQPRGLLLFFLALPKPGSRHCRDRSGVRPATSWEHCSFSKEITPITQQ